MIATTKKKHTSTKWVMFEESPEVPVELTDEELQLFTDPELDDEEGDQRLEGTRGYKGLEHKQTYEERVQEETGQDGDEGDSEGEGTEAGDNEVIEALEDTLADPFTTGDEVSAAIKDVKREFPQYLGRDWVAVLVQGLLQRYPANGFATTDSRGWAYQDFKSIWSVLPFWASDPSFKHGKIDVRGLVAKGVTKGPNERSNAEFARFLQDIGEVGHS
jgi:hypothetical protein